jgi:hypothetical protein
LGELGDKTEFFMLNGESACLRKRRSAILLLRKIHSSQELLETAGGAQQIGLWSNFGPDQRGVTLLVRLFQPCECLIHISRCRVEHRHITRRNISLG